MVRAVYGATATAGVAAMWLSRLPKLPYVAVGPATACDAGTGLARNAAANGSKLGKEGHVNGRLKALRSQCRVTGKRIAAGEQRALPGALSPIYFSPTARATAAHLRSSISIASLSYPSASPKQTARSGSFR